jgi:hypothetical protein
MIGLLCFVLAVLASPFKSKVRLEAENAVLRHQLNVLRRRLHGRVRLRTMIAGSLSSCIAGFHQSCRFNAISPVELTEHTLKRIEALDGDLHCFLHVAADSALEGW